MREYKYIIKDEEGIHARPAGLLVKKASEYACDVSIEANGKKVDAKRIFGVMGLAAKCGQEIIITTEGDAEEEAIAGMSEFLEQNL